MAPQSHIVATLRLPKDQLQRFDFSECAVLGARKPRKRPAKPAKQAKPAKPAKPRARAASAKSEPGDDDGDELDAPTPVKRFASAEPRATSAGSGIISGGGADPILGNLPRSVKAAPVANTAGLLLDKTPCRQWTRRPVVWKSFTGFSYSVTAWCSDYTAAELEEKVKLEAELEAAGADKDKGVRASKRATAAAKPKGRKLKLEDDTPLPSRDGSEQQEDPAETEDPADAEDAADGEDLVDQEPPSEAASDLASEPPSEPPSELQSEMPSELPSELLSEMPAV